MDRWVNLNKQKPEYGAVVEVMHAITGAGAPGRPAFAYKGKARYREPSATRSLKITPMSYWVFEMIKHEPGYNILDKGGLAPTHWRRINVI